MEGGGVVRSSFRMDTFGGEPSFFLFLILPECREIVREWLTMKERFRLSTSCRLLRDEEYIHRVPRYLLPPYNHDLNHRLLSWLELCKDLLLVKFRSHSLADCFWNRYHHDSNRIFPAGRFKLVEFEWRFEGPIQIDDGMIEAIALEGVGTDKVRGSATWDLYVAGVGAEYCTFVGTFKYLNFIRQVCPLLWAIMFDDRGNGQ
jgi:hypothetical protein